MRVVALSIAALLLCLLGPRNAAAETEHTVYDGQTIGRIAKRYSISIAELCEANNMTRRDKIKPGMKLIIPDPGSSGTSAKTRPAEKDEEPASEPEREDKPKPEEEPAKPEPKRTVLPGGMHVLEIPGSGPAYYFEPSGPGRQSLRPVLVYLHGRGGHPAEDCRRWAPVARRLGWIVCPSGPGAQGDGRGWNNTWMIAHRAARGAVLALRERYGRRVQLRGNTLIGFSEGAYAAMNVGVREPRTFNRWLILAGDAKYWGGPGMTALQENRNVLRRVVFMTGEQDGVLAGTHTAVEWLRKARVATRVYTLKGVGHELALQRRHSTYHAALIWLEKGRGKEKEDETLAVNR
ncbi:MAG TPA: LysM peptidoglycan-binding domain-containing protein [Polyangiaceae bacterium]|nr:LysM peptidoglycan-binding domain-containing protein [Polyangiaceae bacterium]